MGQCLCSTDESTLTTPIGSVAVKHCDCFGKKEREEDAAMKQINTAIRAELADIEIRMRTQMLENLRAHGHVMPIHVGEQKPAVLPQRTLSVRVKTLDVSPPMSPVLVP
jgi:hypothetical protein